MFEELGTPTRAEVLDVARRTAEHLDELLRKSGRSLEREADEPVPELLLDELGLASCYAAAAQGISVSGARAGKPQLRLVFGTGPVPESSATGADEPVAEHRCVNVHARQRCAPQSSATSPPSTRIHQTLHHFLQAEPRHAEQLGGSRLVAVGATQRRTDELGFEGVEATAQVQTVGARGFLGFRISPSA